MIITRISTISMTVTPETYLRLIKKSFALLMPLEIICFILPTPAFIALPPPFCSMDIRFFQFLLNLYREQRRHHHDEKDYCQNEEHGDHQLRSCLFSQFLRLIHPLFKRFL